MFKAPKLISVAAVIGISLGITSYANASENVEYKTSSNSIELEVNVNNFNSLKVYDGKQEMEFELKGTSILIDDLDSENIYNLTVVYLDKNEDVLEFDYFKISTDREDSNEIFTFKNIEEDENKLSETHMDSMYVDGQVSIEWYGNIPNDDETFKVLRNGKEIGSTSDQHYIDKDVMPGENYTYEVSTKKEVDKDTFNERLTAAKEGGIEITPEIKKEISYDSYSVGSYIEIPNNDFETHMDNMERLSVLNRWGIQYTTFIADAIVTDLADGLYPYNYHLGGDNRGFDPYHNSFRTRTAIYADFTNNRVMQDMLLPGMNARGIGVGETIEYHPSGGVANRDTIAGYFWNFGIDSGGTSTSQTWNAEHSVGIPIEIARVRPPNIDYNYLVNMNSSSTSNASGRIVGSHDRAPNHEIAIYVPESGFAVNIYEFTNEGFFHLFPEPISANREFNISF